MMPTSWNATGKTPVEYDRVVMPLAEARRTISRLPEKKRREMIEHRRAAFGWELRDIPTLAARPAFLKKGVVSLTVLCPLCLQQSTHRVISKMGDTVHRISDCDCWMTYNLTTVQPKETN